MIEEAGRSEDVPTPLRTQGVVDDDQEFLQAEGLNDQTQEHLEEDLRTKLELGEEPVEAALVPLPGGAPTQASDVPLARLNEPRDRHRDQVRPTSFGKSEAAAQDDFGKFRCALITNHGPSPSSMALHDQYARKGGEEATGHYP